NLIHVEVDYNTPSPESTFNLRVFRPVVDAFGNIKIETDETFSNLSMDADSGNSVATIVSQQSTLVNAEIASTAPLPGEGYSRSGILVDPGNDANVINLLNGLIASASTIAISVDGKAPATVALPALVAAPNALQAWEEAINFALTSTGAQITAKLVPGGPTGSRYIEFRSKKPDGGSVVISAAPVNSAAAALQLGVDQGGVEVSGFAAARPAPSGFFARFGDPDLTNLTNFAGSLKSAFGQWKLTDVSGTGLHSATPVFA